MKEVDIDRSIYKIAALGAAGVILAGLFGYELFSLSAAPDLSRTLIIIGLGVGWLSLLTLRTFLIKSAKIALGLIFLEILALWTFMPQKFAGFNLLGAVILLIFLTIGFIGGRADINNSLKIKFWHTSRRTIPAAMTGLAILITFYVLQSFKLTEFSIPRGAFDLFLKSSEPIAAVLIPNFSLDAKVNDVLRSFVESRLPPGTPAPVISEAVAGLKTSIREATGINISGEERVGDALYDISIARLLDLPSAVKTLALISLGLLIFLFLKGLALILNWVIIILAFLIFQMLLALNFLHIGLESQNKEIIVVN